MRIERCGVCHSDLHLQDGYFSLGGDKKLDVSAGRTLPFTLGHEIAGVIESVGADADAAIVGRRVAVYPWIGCGICAACLGGEENLCSNHRHLGIAVDGGFATHVLVPIVNVSVPTKKRLPAMPCACARALKEARSTFCAAPPRMQHSP